MCNTCQIAMVSRVAWMESPLGFQSALFLPLLNFWFPVLCSDVTDVRANTLFLGCHRIEDWCA